MNPTIGTISKWKYFLLLKLKCIIRFLLVGCNNVLVFNLPIIKLRELSSYTFPIDTHMPTKKVERENAKNYV